MIPFEHLFQFSQVAKFTKVITTTEFTKNLMPTLWPPQNRTSFCWSPRQSIFEKSAKPGCHPKEGSPFGPYWNHLNVEFVSDQFFGDIPGGYDLNVLGARRAWIEKYPSSEYPVLAFSSAPAVFPIKIKNLANSKIFEMDIKNY
ncbi:unnamed protein product [Caenorhabditis angaria]|uniref:Uncharacterized protein n=1 Tax=Caenorhabditis angaria TaxID=860376 RepID=A0A9P1J1T3_9PELO|nr:unnamed protein product [Caenorhabditis angaria]